ncbi:MAG: hypothetical protein J4F29_13510 [Candidatus Latescibacteria bacterium]|nr:hypothetical protein [Candidatus Latescibacterota bacterium]
MADVFSEWAQYIEAIESGYELMLAYAAQGIEGDNAPDSQIRHALKEMNDALANLGEPAARIAEERGLVDYRDFLDAMNTDAQKAQAGINLVLGKPAISSQLIDNLNASIHLRALLTDLFLIDEALK